MTDTPGREPEREGPERQEPGDLSEGQQVGAEQRLPVPRPPDDASVQRFSSPPSARSIELSPERAAQIVRQSSNARWIGFLAVVVVALFVALYWFYEVGGPLGVSEPRLESEITAQQVLAVERGYNVYEANCARCHGEHGEGGIGPVLNRQDKLFAHLSEDYLRNIMNAGGRYACGNADSIMPVWADTGHPPGPLNYRQIEELIAFLRATNDQEFVARDEELLDPRVDPVTGEIVTFTGWRDPNYVPEAGATPYPDCWEDEFSGGASAAPGASIDPDLPVVEVTASGIAFTPTELTAPADAVFALRFDNQDAGIPHDVQVKDAGGTVIFKTDVFPGAEARDYQAPALAAGSYDFVCSVHPTMTGTLTAS